jgi:glucose/arabinose dehydrogenase
MLLLTLTVAHAQAPINPADYALTLVTDGLTQPLGLAHAGDDRLFIVQKSGQVRVFKAGALLPTPFLDVSGLIGTASERGLLGLAFHPDYAANGWVFINYTNTVGATVIARLTRSAADPDQADAASRVTVLSVARNRSNHNGGHLAFGPDGYLYIGMGDSGGGGDPDNSAQSPTDLRGKMLRINVDTLPYTIPPDNPFIGPQTPDVADEVWALGLRNPWRYSFDRLTGDLYIADVGQNAREEVSFQAGGSPGGQNYQWRRLEGTFLYSPSTVLTLGTSTPPILEYPHTEGSSITGGYVYRGSELPALTGYYLFGDFINGQTWLARRTGGGAWVRLPFLNNGQGLSSFGEDAAGELYLMNLFNGRLFKLTQAASAAPIRNRYPAGPFTLTWVGISGATAYQIQIASSLAFINPLVLPSNTDSVEVTGLEPGHYYWRVRAAVSAGVWGGWSAADRFVVG